jgi:hypothetical protein
MKRGFITLFLLVLLVSPMILAQEEGETKERVNILQKDITIPSFEFLYLVQVPGFTIQLSWVQLIVYIVTVAFLFIGALEILSYTALETDWVKVLIAGVFVALVGIFGILQMIIDFFYHALDNFKLIAWGIVILIVGALLIKPIMAGVKKSKRLSKAEELGAKGGAVLKSLKHIGETSTKAE